MLRSPRNDLDNGEIEMRLVLYTMKKLKSEQHEFRSRLVAEFGEDVNILVYNGDAGTTALQTWFKNIRETTTARFCREGIFIILAHDMIDAGITVAPRTGPLVHHGDDGHTYVMHGITDLFLNVSEKSHLEGIEQFHRCNGYYPAGHLATVWVNNVEGRIALVDIIDRRRDELRAFMHNPMEYAYTQHQRGARLIGRLCVDDPCTDIERSTSHLVPTIITDADRIGRLYATEVVLRTVDMPRFAGARATNGGMILDQTLGSFYNNHPNRQSHLRRACGFGDGDNGQIPYNDSRLNELLKSIFAPYGQWLVQSILLPPVIADALGNRIFKDPSVTLIRECSIVRFTEDPRARPTHQVGDATYSYGFQLPGGTFLTYGYDARTYVSEIPEAIKTQHRLMRDGVFCHSHEFVTEAYNMAADEIDKNPNARTTKCSLCGAAGTNKSTCPHNPAARHPKPELHR